MIFIKLHVCWKTPPTMPVEWHFSWADSVRLKASHWSCLLSLGQTLARNWGTQWGKWLKMMIENDNPWTLSPWRRCFTKVPGRIDANSSKMWFHMIRIHQLETKSERVSCFDAVPDTGSRAWESWRKSRKGHRSLACDSSAPSVAIKSGRSETHVNIC